MERKKGGTVTVGNEKTYLNWSQVVKHLRSVENKLERDAAFVASSRDLMRNEVLTDQAEAVRFALAVICAVGMQKMEDETEHICGNCKDWDEMCTTCTKKGGGWSGQMVYRHWSCSGFTQKEATP